MLRTNNLMLKRLNDSKPDTAREVLYTLAFIAVVTVWLTIDFFTKLADTL